MKLSFITPEFLSTFNIAVGIILSAGETLTNTCEVSVSPKSSVTFKVTV